MYVSLSLLLVNSAGSEVLIHFDGWGPEYDYWCAAGSVELHPPGWCHAHHWELQMPLSESCFTREGTVTVGVCVCVCVCECVCVCVCVCVYYSGSKGIY